MTDLIIIGAGPGGYETAIEAAHRGMTVTLINDGPLGGVCLNEGCIPTKTFCHHAGITPFGEAAERKAAVVEQLRNGVAYLLNNERITLVEGHAAFKDAATVVVGDEEYQARDIIIATGSRAARLPIAGVDLPLVLDSTDVLALSELPATVCVIGGGVIGLEMASYLHRFGCQVTVLEYAPQVLPAFDAEVSKRLKMMLSRQGIKIETDAQVTAVNEEGVVTYINKKGKTLEVVAEKVLMAVGRAPRTEGLNLEAAGIDYGRKGIVVDENMATTASHVYAIGDVNGKMMLAHVASFQGVRALNHIQGKADKIRFDLVPAAVFTTPEVATVGRTEAQCDDEELDYSVSKALYGANGKAVAMDATDGFCKLLVDNATGQLLGCHIIGAHSSDIIHEVTALMNLGATVEQARDIIHAHPTLSEVFQMALHSIRN
ncbi:MAG: NAD(P)/FAD-dependent oxidoreductase [Muribaculaceae bacterium]|nr:NAD(P)/FAD-dependent oxidoreductase [Muribaculaceae bacterium]